MEIKADHVYEAKQILPIKIKNEEIALIFEKLLIASKVAFY